MNAKEFFQQKRAEEEQTGGEIVELDARVYKHKRKKRRLILTITIAAAAVICCFWLVLSFQSYTKYSEISSTPRTDENSGSYLSLGSYVVRYTNNGAVGMNSDQDELWQQSYEMDNPVTAVRGDTLAIADKGGNKVYVFSKKGALGNFSTQLPIQSLSVSEQGVVEAIIHNDEQTRVVCYDNTGTILVDSRASLNNTGYPLAAAISKDGKRMLVSYVSVGETFSSRLVCYDFGTAGQSEEQMKILDETCDDVLIPTVFFADENTAVAVGDKKMIFYKNSDTFSKKSEVAFSQQVKSVVWDDSGLALISKSSSSQNKYTLTSYNFSGKKKASSDFSDEYTSAQMVNGKIILLNDTKCVIFSAGGRVVFRGEFDTTLNNVIPLKGINKYLVARSDTVQTIRLIK